MPTVYIALLSYPDDRSMKALHPPFLYSLSALSGFVFAQTLPVLIKTKSLKGKRKLRDSVPRIQFRYAAGDLGRDYKYIVYGDSQKGVFSLDYEWYELSWSGKMYMSMRSFYKPTLSTRPS